MDHFSPSPPSPRVRGHVPRSIRAQRAVCCRRRLPPQPLEGSCDGYVRCMDDLHLLVATIMIERFAFTLFFDNWLPRAMAYKRFLDETKGVDPSKAN